jgi:FhaA, N-terminal domain/FHA domain
MSVLRSIESKIEGLFEGVFGRAFRTHVQPVELARKLAREMDEHRTVSVSRVYVPNEYTIYLSPPDRAQFASYEGSLIGELQEYLAEHARRENFALLTPPRVVMRSDDDLSIGEFGIATRTVQPGGDEQESELEPGHTMVYRPKAPVPTEAVPLEELIPEREVVTLTIRGHEHPIEGNRVVLGRSRDSDLQIEDANVSRRHAEVRQEGTTYWLVDLDSTNGTELNGTRVQRAKLSDGDRITLGETEVVFGRSVA